MNRIDRYISGLFWLYFLGGLLVFVTVFVSIQAMSDMNSFENIPVGVWAKYYAYFFPEIIYRMVPVAALLGTVFTISTLNKNNELVALFSMGMSLARIAMPIMVWVSLICGFQIYLSDQILPSFAKYKNFTYYHEIKKNPSLYSIVKTNRIWYRSKNTIFNLKVLNEKQQRAQGLTLYSFDEQWNLLQMIVASEVDLQKSQWNLKKGSVTIFTEDSSFPETVSFKEKTIQVGEDANDLSSTANTSDVLSLRELSNYIQKNKDAGLDTLKYEVDYHAKFGYACAGLVMCLLGIPFSVGKTRSGGKFVNLGICLGLVFIYWIFFSSFMTLGSHGAITPVLSAWLPNVSTALLGYLILKYKKE